MSTQTIHTRPGASTLITHTIRIRIPRAQHVALVGDFNHWHTTAHPLTQIAPDLWETSLALPPGLHRYAFFILEDFRHTAGMLRSRIEKHSAILCLPTSADHPIHLAPDNSRWRQPEKLSA